MFLYICCGEWETMHWIVRPQIKWLKSRKRKNKTKQNNIRQLKEHCKVMNNTWISRRKIDKKLDWFKILPIVSSFFINIVVIIFFSRSFSITVKLSIQFTLCCTSLRAAYLNALYYPKQYCLIPYHIKFSRRARFLFWGAISFGYFGLSYVTLNALSIYFNLLFFFFNFPFHLL